MARRRRGRPVHGWLVVDKPLGIGSTPIVGRVRRLLDAEKAGHGGTLDPLATGLLPIALGEATKTVAYAMDGRKEYEFRVRWGEATATDDAEGEVVATSDVRPARAEIQAALPRFVGDIDQVPPRYSAIKVQGERAYDLARGGGTVELAARTVHVEALELLDQSDADHADFRVACGKGTYVRSLARDIAQVLGTVGHVVRLRRTRVGGFGLEHAISLDELERLTQSAPPEEFLLPIETVLDDIPALALTEAEAQRIRQGQAVALLRREDRARLESLGSDSIAFATSDGRPVALVRVDGGQVHPVRVINL